MKPSNLIAAFVMERVALVRELEAAKRARKTDRQIYEGLRSEDARRIAHLEAALLTAEQLLAVVDPTTQPRGNQK